MGSLGWENAEDVSTPTLPCYMRSLTISSFASSPYPLPHLSLYPLPQEGQYWSSTEIMIWAEDTTYSPIPWQRCLGMLWKYSTVFTESMKDLWKQFNLKSPFPPSYSPRREYARRTKRVLLPREVFISSWLGASHTPLCDLTGTSAGWKLHSWWY